MTGFRHEALFYAGAGDFLAGTVPRIRDTVASDGTVLVAVDPARTGVLCEALGREADAVAFADMPELGRNPACMLPVWKQFVRDHARRGRPLLGVGEPVWAARSAAELVECQRHESLLNLAFDGGPEWTLICPYDTARLQPAAVAGARRSHRIVNERGVCSRSDAYADGVPGDDLPEPAGAPVELPFSRADLGIVRVFVRDYGRRAGIRPERLPDLVLAVNELVSNSIRHAPGAGGVARAWRERDAFVCEVSDRGRIRDPLAGREPLAYDAPNGRGLWLVNHLCDLVQVRSSAAGTVVRLHMRLA